MYKVSKPPGTILEKRYSTWHRQRSINQHRTTKMHSLVYLNRYVFGNLIDYTTQDIEETH